MGQPSHTFKTPRHPDIQIVRLAKSAFERAEIRKVTVSLTAIVPSIQFSGPLETIEGLKDAKVLWESDRPLTKDITFTFANNQASVRIVRESHLWHDDVHVTFSQDPARTSAVTDQQILVLLVGLKSALGELTTQDFLAQMGVQVKTHYEARESELVKLESLVARIAHQFTHDAAEQRRLLDSQFEGRQKVLEAAIQQERSRIADEAKQHDVGLADREAALQKRISEIDDRDAKHARRALRRDLIDKLTQRAERFELTRGTRRLRTPVNVLSIVLLALAGGGLAYAFYHVIQVPSSPGGEAWSSWIHLGVGAAAFCSAAVFFIRWNNRWFEQHASEEFQLKRLEIDLDRASWVVEIAMEWKDAKGSELPAKLLEQLTANLFTQPGKESEPLHPADQLASALLGVSASSKVKLPGGSEVTFDRKSHKDLKKSQQ